jgi:drug/metabolite transporter (DMT)-like permease
MRTIGVLLIVLGVIALAVPSITFFTQDRVADVGFFHIDVARPHTIIINPIAGIVALAAGAVLLLSGRRAGSPV